MGYTRWRDPGLSARYRYRRPSTTTLLCMYRQVGVIGLWIKKAVDPKIASGTVLCQCAHTTVHLYISALHNEASAFICSVGRWENWQHRMMSERLSLRGPGGELKTGTPCAFHRLAPSLNILRICSRTGGQADRHAQEWQAGRDCCHLIRFR